MNNVSLSRMDAQRVLDAADTLIATVRKRNGNGAQLERELMGEKWRITIERISDIEEAKQ